MNVRLKRQFVFACGVSYQDHFFINQYSVTLHMITQTENSDDHNVAFDRIRYWINNVLTDSVLISADNPLLDAYKATNQRLLVFPDQPVDQLVGIMLYLKTNCMVENRMAITDVEIQSLHGMDVCYLHSQGESVGSLSEPGWWLDSKPTWADPTNHATGKKVIELNREADWKSVDLDWNMPRDQKQTNDSVVFADFNKDETQ